MASKSQIKWNIDMVNKVDEYYDACLADTDRLPTMDELSLYLGVNDNTMVEWCAIPERSDFKDAIARVKKLQAVRLQTMGVKGKYNAAMSIFLLKVNHGKVETTRQELTGQDGGPIKAVTTYMPEPLKIDYYANDDAEQ